MSFSILVSMLSIYFLIIVSRELIDEVINSGMI